MSLDIGKVAIALGALLAYKNRDRIGDWVDQQRGPATANAPAGSQRSGGGLLDGIFGPGGGGGLQDILDRFRNAGGQAEVDSWVGNGQNRPVSRGQVERAIDPQIIDALSAQTGLSRDELLERIQRDLPDAVSDLTPDGRLPSESRAGGDRGPWSGNDTGGAAAAGTSGSTRWADPSGATRDGGLLDDVPGQSKWKPGA